MVRCKGCDVSASCKIAAGIPLLVRVRPKLLDTGHNPWLLSRIDEFMSAETCLAIRFGLVPDCEAPERLAG